MSIEKLARSAVDVVAGRLAQRGTDAAGRLTDTAVDGVYQLIAHRLQGSATGRRLLALLHRNPGNEEGRAQAAEMVADEAHSDPKFAESLGRAAARAGILVQGAGASYQQNIYDNSGDFRNINVRGARDVKLKKYHIGNLRFDTGGLVAGVITLIAILGGGTAAVVATTGDSVNLASVVGRWEQSAYQPMPGWTVGPIVLTVANDGRFTFSMKAKMGAPGGPVPPGTPADFGQLNLDCGGMVTADGDHFTLRTTSGPCGAFEAKLAPDNTVLDVFITNGSVDGAQSLTKVG